MDKVAASAGQAVAQAAVQSVKNQAAGPANK